MELRKAAFSGLRIQFYLRVSNTVFYQVSAVVLAILLVPRDFALVGLAMVFVGFTLSIADFGLGSALIQRPSGLKDALTTGASLRLLISSVLAVVLVAVAPIVGVLYGEPALTVLIWSLSPLLILNFMGFVSRVTLTKNLQFRRVFLPDVLGGAVQAVVAIVLAFSGFSYWSLVAGQLAGTSAGVAALYYMLPWRLHWELDRSLVSELLRFGMPLIFAGVLYFLFQNVGVAVLGAVSLPGVGYFLFAQTWTISIPLGLRASFDHVMFPVFSAMNGEIARVTRAYEKLFKYLVWIVAPGSAFLAAAAPSFVLSLVGPIWSPSIPVLQILAIAGFAIMLSLTYHSAVLALGLSREILKYNAIALALAAPLSVVAVTVGGAVGLAWAFLVVGGGLLVWAFFRAERIMPGSTGVVVVPLAQACLGSVLCALPFALVQSLVPPSLLALAFQGLGAIGLYFVAMTLVTRGYFLKELTSLVGSVIRA